MPMNEKNSYDSVVCICQGKDCREKGSKELFKYLHKSMKEKGVRHKKILLVKTKCLDHCKNGPVAIINNKIITRFRKEDASGML